MIQFSFSWVIKIQIVGVLYWKNLKRVQILFFFQNMRFGAGAGAGAGAGIVQLRLVARAFFENVSLRLTVKFILQSTFIIISSGVYCTLSSNHC
jgi:hypothetical protein